METQTTQHKQSKARVHEKGALSESENQWFEDFIAQIKAHKLMLETKTATKSLEELYRLFFTGDQVELAQHSKRSADKLLIKKAVLDYIELLKEGKSIPKKLSFDLSDCHVMVWAEVRENDEKTEDNLILAEAKVNNKYSNKGIDISSTILEDCDNVPAPANYTTIL